jgi:hypothetical protein
MKIAGSFKPLRFGAIIGKPKNDVSAEQMVETTRRLNGFRLTLEREIPPSAAGNNDFGLGRFKPKTEK